jgi:WD40 repeat protein
MDIVESSGGGPRIFISYAHSDGEDIAQRVMTLAEGHGLSPGLDKVGLVGGEDWWRQAAQILDHAEHRVLILTPDALGSKNVEKEWAYAREHRVEVSPVRAASVLDTSVWPRWMRAAHYYNLDVPEHQIRFLRGLEGPSTARRVRFMDPLQDSAAFIDRPQEFSDLQQHLLDESGDAVAVTVALLGAGGFGKTALATHLCRSSEIRDAFYDGILWATLGEAPGDPVAALADLTELLTDKRPGVSGLPAAQEALADALDDRRCLLVIDDAWQSIALRPFLHRGQRDQTARLITTRDDRVLPDAGVHRIAIGAMQPTESSAFLRRGLSASDVDPMAQALDALANRLSHWPLLLELANALLRRRLKNGQALGAAVADLDRALDSKGLSKAFPVDDAGDRRRTAAGTLAISIEHLPSGEDQRCFQQLGVFVEDVDVTITSAAALWAIDDYDATAVCVRLNDLSLLSRFDLDRGVLQLQDVVRRILREQLGADGMRKLHNALIDAWHRGCGGEWAQLRDDYALRYLPAHLLAADRGRALDALLLDPRWIEAKLRAINAQALLADYRVYARDPASAARLVGRALELAAGARALDAAQLPGQLLGRLAPDDASGLEACLASAREQVPTGALEPVWPSLTPPGAEVRRLEGHKADITGMATLDDGTVVSCGFDGTLLLWDMTPGSESRTAATGPYGMTCIAALRDGRIVSGDMKGRLWIWDPAGKAEPDVIEASQKKITCLAVLPDGRIVSGGHERQLRLDDLVTGSALHSAAVHSHWVTCVTVLPDGRIVSGDVGGAIRIWNPANMLEPRVIPAHKAPVSSVAALADGRFVSGSDDVTLKVWSPEDESELCRFEKHGSWISSVAVLSEGRIASGDWGATLRVWDARTGAQLHVLRGHEGRIGCIAALPDGRIVSGAGDQTLRIWDARLDDDRRRHTGHKDRVGCIALMQDGRAMSIVDVKTVRVWDPVTNVELYQLEGEYDWFKSAALLRDGRIVSAGLDPTLWLWDPATSPAPRTLGTHRDDVRSPQIGALPDGRILSASFNDNALLVWDPAKEMVSQQLAWFERNVTSMAVLPDGRVVTRDHDGKLWISDPASNTPPYSINDDQTSAGDCISVLPDGRIVSGDFRGSLLVWSCASGAPPAQIGEHGDYVTCIGVFSDGRIISGGDDRTLRIWDVGSARQTTSFRLDATPQEIVCLTTERVLARDANGSLHLLDVKGKPTIVARDVA